MNEASARSSRASAPVSTTKRAPDSFAARSKSISPSASPSSKCSRAGNSKAGGCPQRRSSTFADSSGPSGTSSAGRFGICCKRRLQLRVRCRLPAPPGPPAPACSVRPPRERPMHPRHVLCAGRSASKARSGAPASPAPRVSASRRARSRVSSRSAAGGKPRRARPTSNASAFSRIHLISSTERRSRKLPKGGLAERSNSVKPCAGTQPSEEI